MHALASNQALTLVDVWVSSPRRLEGVSLALVPGEVAGVVGPSGAGKSSLLEVAAGILIPSRGSAVVCGVPAGSRPARHLVGYAGRRAAFPAALTVRETLTSLARLHGGPRQTAMVERALELTGAGTLADVRAGRLAVADRRRIALTQAVLGGRRVVVLDELLSGLDPVARRDLRHPLGRIAAEGVAVLIAATDPSALEGLVARVFVLREGRIVRAGVLSGLLRDRILEVILDRPPAEPPPGFRITASGVETPLTGRTPEAALALCRAHRLAVRATRVRLKSLEEVVLDAHDGAR